MLYFYAIIYEQFNLHYYLLNAAILRMPKLIIGEKEKISKREKVDLNRRSNFFMPEGG